MLLMISTFHLKVKKGLGMGLGLLSIVVIHSPIRSLMLKLYELFTEVPSGSELLRITIKGLLMMEGGRSSASLQAHQTSNPNSKWGESSSIRHCYCLYQIKA